MFGFELLVRGQELVEVGDGLRELAELQVRVAAAVVDERRVRVRFDRLGEGLDGLVVLAFFGVGRALLERGLGRLLVGADHGSCQDEGQEGNAHGGDLGRSGQKPARYYNVSNHSYGAFNL